ncbi:hypothetical protein D0962_37770 [Leptolyngbyaceae cyanobacterium CCMR0082]|uniref:Uncharacterized protein n=1 Tax=Adonisia turfae CCMR0082 TaxID=2304604 RepID=A0A6M0SMI0_9CYAN|nr:hypothetical protein [Adonisia turfae]NEZ68402.1 hypothetical protein [Adonisia turfae CCMR0082]
MQSSFIQPSQTPKTVAICCPRCAGSTGAIGEGKGPHAAKVTCRDCGRFIQWLSKRSLADLLGGEQS